jgi:hypothetical protein
MQGYDYPAAVGWVVWVCGGIRFIIGDVQLRVDVRGFTGEPGLFAFLVAVAAQRESDAAAGRGGLHLRLPRGQHCRPGLVLLPPRSMSYRKFQQMAELVTQVGDPFDKKRSYKFPFTAADLLASETPFVLERLLPEEGTITEEERVVTAEEREVEQEVDDDDGEEGE